MYMQEITQIPEAALPPSISQADQNELIQTPVLEIAPEKNPKWNKLSIFSGIMLLMSLIYIIYICIYAFNINFIRIHFPFILDGTPLYLAAFILFIFICPLLSFISGLISNRQIQKTRERGVIISEFSVISSSFIFVIIAFLIFLYLVFAEKI